MTGRRLPETVERAYPWLVVAASLGMIVVGQGIQFVLSVSLKTIAGEFDWPRQVPSLAYACSFLGAGIGALYLGHLSDRVGMGPVALLGAVSIGTGSMLTSLVTEPWQLYAIFGVLIGLLGNATIFSPLMANTTRWFDRRRGIALGIVASGQSLGGTVWPPLAEAMNGWVGWRATFFWYGVMALVTMTSMVLVLRRRAPGHTPAAAASGPRPPPARVLGWPPWIVQALLCGAIVGCCVPMALPLVHLVAYVTDVGHSTGEAARVLSVALAMSFISRIGGGALADRIGGLRTVFLGSALQGTMIGVLVFTRELPSFFLVGAAFGLGYGGIIAMYAFIAREFFTTEGIGRRLAVIYLFGTTGMALGGWIGGAVHDATGSYQAAFAIGAAFNAMNLALIGMLILRSRARPAAAPA